MKLSDINVVNGVIEGTNINVKPFFIAGYDRALLKRNEYVPAILGGRLITDYAKYIEIDGKYFIIDGHYMLNSLIEYRNNKYPIYKTYFDNLTEENKRQILNTEINLEFIHTTETLLPTYLKQIRPEFYKSQEITNSLFYGPWLDDMMNTFANNESEIANLLNIYISGNMMRCQKMEQCIKTVCGDMPVNKYMALQYSKPDAKEFKDQFMAIILWFHDLFYDLLPDCILAKKVNIGKLYNKYHKNFYNKELLGERLDKALSRNNEPAFKTSGIFEYALKENQNDQILYNRRFPISFVLNAYRKDNTCAICGKPITSLNEAEGDHIIPWAKGGTTTYKNFQLAHKICNIKKGIKC